MRQKVRLREMQKIEVKAKHEATVLPELKKWLNSLPWQDRVKVAWLLIWGKW